MFGVEWESVVTWQELNEEWEQEEGDEDGSGGDGDAGPFSGGLLGVAGLFEGVGPAADEGAGVGDVGLDVVELVALGVHEGGHVEEYLVELEEAALDLLDRLVPLLDLRYRVHYLPSPLLFYRLLHQHLALAARYQLLYRLFAPSLPRHREIPDSPPLTLLSNTN